MSPLEYSRVTVAAALVSLEQAKDHLAVTDDLHDADITAKLAEAQDFVIGRLGAAADATWVDSTAPPGVLAAIKIMLDTLYERRGGDEAAEEIKKSLSTIDHLLSNYRDLGLA